MGHRDATVSMVALLAAVLLLSILGGCATTGAGANAVDEVAYDPWEDTNRAFFAFNNALDEALLKPVSNVYVAAVPGPLRDNVLNFFDNLVYPNVVVNLLLQGKIEQAIEGTGRFIINSTIGIGGIVDIASGIGLERRDEDLGQTLAVWGVSEGAYLDLPFFGPNTVRSVPGIPMRSALNPIYFAEGAAAFPVSALGVIDKRARFDTAIKVRDETALDPYVFQREAYRQRRLYLIYDGEPPLDDLEDLEEPAGD